MSHVYNSAKARILKGEIDFDTDDIRIFLLSTNTTADTQNSGVSTCADITTPDHFDGSGYNATSGIALSGEAVNTDDANNRAEFDADDVTSLSYGNGTRQIAGALLVKFVTNFAGSYPIGWIDTGGFPFDGASLSSVLWNAEGILQAA